ncbi:LysR family transcriptional regulator [Salinisphaera sp. Q1T1-3]|uniref:LysR family transcriptional regulator n=1 Tax=Salinisphaera sp. Q1T1-3 TaxID=2321229 RepID=UPI000E750820|nr:LysR family transcriptional regulator [Salinisphaera sp. Q1T1-3]RJS95020.1 LysR family transcriptional regulator [Salinisphaera sp. Q1T1-3]
MRIDALLAFVAVAETGSFGAAALRLHLSQPAVSKRLAGLEARLGHRLLDRTGREVDLTEAGQAYLPHARQTIAALADGDRALDNLSERIEGQLDIALSHHVGMHRMPAVLRRFVARYPAVSPQISFADSELACAQVVNGESELAVITLPVTPHPRLIALPIWHDPLDIYVGNAHALAGRETVTADELARHAAVLPPPESYTFAIVASAFASAGAVPRPRMTSHSLETLRMLADVGLGWTVLPRAMPNALTPLAVPGVTMARTLGVMRHPQRTLSNAARALVAMLETEATEIAAGLDN